MPIEVLCIGHAAYDLSFFVEAFPAENSKCQTDDLLASCGGPAANAAYLLSKWDRNCALAGLVGEDEYGRRIRESLQSVGTDVSLLELRPGHATPLSMILVNTDNGSRTIVNRSISNARFDVGHEAWRTLSPRVLLFDGHALDASLAAIDAFPEAISILDAGSWREGTATLAQRVDILASSERFASQCTNRNHLSNEIEQRQCVSLMREKFDTTVIVTLGERGAIIDDGTGFVHQPAFAVDAVDTTAAGDIFHGALAYCVADCLPLLQSVRFASMAAALSVQKRGGRCSIPDLSQVQLALRKA
ncbi:MAG: carbohydrate kinase family protein [Rubripirellula sp.]